MTHDNFDDDANGPAGSDRAIRRDPMSSLQRGINDRQKELRDLVSILGVKAFN